MPNQYEATLPTGKTVVLEELSTERQMLALSASSEHQSESQGRFAAQLESVRLMLKQVAGKPVAYDEIQGNKIDQVFTPKEVNALMILYGSIMGADETEKKAILLSLKMKSGAS